MINILTAVIERLMETAYLGWIVLLTLMLSVASALGALIDIAIYLLAFALFVICGVAAVEVLAL